MSYSFSCHRICARAEQSCNMRINDVAVRCYADIIFVVDESASDNFDERKWLMSRFVSSVVIGGSKTQVGVVTYSAVVDTTQAFNLNVHSSAAALKTAISALSYSANGTRTDLGLAYVRNTMLTSGAGDRPDYPNVVVVMTDGRSTQPALTEVSTILLLFLFSNNAHSSELSNVVHGRCA